MRSSKDFGLRAPLPEPFDLSQRIIENYRQNSQPVRQDYLQYLAQKSLSYADEMQQQRENGAHSYNVEKSTESVVDRIFAILESYSLQLNKLSQCRDLFISTTAPARLQEVQEYNRFRQPLKSLNVYRTRFSTQRLSLVIRGMGHLVEFFLLPGDRVIGLSRAEADVSPLMVFQSEAGLTGLSWFVEAKPLTADRMERYSLLALEHLLDKTREEVGYTY
ncbi:MAG: hypothetical protein JST01_08085 [Cyanobacteria bacterium SZAS TMP-1]|nr:hypothetical protein [Cyanobacteria bacterium SZAS TMP-1]